MNNQQAIIDKIMTDAEQYKANVLATAQNEVNDILSLAKTKAQDYIDANKYKIERTSNEVYERAKIKAKLEEKKVILNVKKSMIDKAFDNALESFRKSKEYKEFIISSIANVAQKGDVIAIGELDKKIFDQDFLDKINKKSKLDLTLSQQYVDIAGGVILIGKSYDKNLSLDIKFQSIREDIEKKVNEILFEESADV